MNQLIDIPIYAAFISILVCILVAQTIIQTRNINFDTHGRLGCLDGLRGLLALGVFVHHYVVTYYFQNVGIFVTPPGSTFYALSGKVAVALFFMITGFLFWNKILASDGNLDWQKLYISRFFRLVPLFWFVILLVLFIVLVKGGFELKEPILKFVFNIFQWFSFLSLPDLNGFSKTGLIIAGVTWTLTYEWIFYFSLPLLAWFLLISKNRPLLIVFLIIFIGFIGIKGFSITRVVHLNTQYLLFFLTGAIAAYIYTLENWKKLFQTGLFSIISFISLLFVFMFFKFTYDYKVVLLLGFFFIPIAMGNSFWGFLRCKALILLGEISYSIYLLHGFILYCIFSLILTKFMKLETSTFILILGMWILGIIVVVISYITYSFIEEPMIKFGKTFITKNKN